MTIRDFQQKIIELMNESKFAVDLLEIIFEKFLAEIHLAADHAYAQASKNKETNEAEAAIEEVTQDELDES